MAQFNISLVSTNDLSRELEVSDQQGRRFTLAYGANYESVRDRVSNSIRKGWTNQAWAMLMSYDPIDVVVLKHRQKSKQGQNNWIPATPSVMKLIEAWDIERSINMDYRKEPNEEYRWTAIAARTVNDSLNYKERHWFKTKEEVEEFIAPIFEANKGRQVQLVIVEAVDLVKPKPQVETITTNLRPNTGE